MNLPPATRNTLLNVLLVSLLPAPLLAEESRFSFGATVTGVMQAGDFDDAFDVGGDPIGDTTRGSMVIDLDGAMTVGASGIVYASASFAEGNGLDGVGGVSVRVNADDLEDDVRDINGHGRDYLLEAWYAQRFDLDDSSSLEIAGGVIDATRYIDANRVANDENHQFMNEVFVNRFFMPSYDIGVAFSATRAAWSASGVWMNTRADDTEGRTEGFNFYGLDIGRRHESAIGEGNFRLIGITTDDSFGDNGSAVHSLGFSMDQSWGEHVILFSRVGGFSDEESVLVYKSLYSAGLQVSAGGLPAKWVGGFAYAFLSGGGNAVGDVRETRVCETYLRWAGGGRFDATLDVQYVADELRGGGNPTLWAIGLRANYSF